MAAGDVLEVPENPCLKCGEPLNRAKGLRGGKFPSPGDIVVCIHCGQVMMYGNGLRLVELTEFDEIELRDSGQWDEIQKVLEVIERAKNND